MCSSFLTIIQILDKLFFLLIKIFAFLEKNAVLSKNCMFLATLEFCLSVFSIFCSYVYYTYITRTNLTNWTLMRECSLVKFFSLSSLPSFNLHSSLKENIFTRKLLVESNCIITQKIYTHITNRHRIFYAYCTTLVQLLFSVFCLFLQIVFFCLSFNLNIKFLQNVFAFRKILRGLLNLCYSLLLIIMFVVFFL